MRELLDSLDQTFQEIRDKATNAELPEEEQVQEFVRLTRLLHSQADEDWVDEAEDCSVMAQKLMQAVKKKQVQDCVLIVESMDELLTMVPRS
jgi:XXXCH domain-containing protein